MRYRTKIILALLLTAFVSIFLALSVNFAKTRELFLQELRSTVLSIATTTAEFIDGDTLKLIKTPEDAQSLEYLKIKELLQSVVNVNRRGDIYVKFAYTLSPSPVKPGQVIFGVDAATLKNEASQPGDIYQEAPEYEIPENYQKPYTPKKFIRDTWGTWMTGMAPVFDSKNAFVGAVAIDISVTDIDQLLHLLLTWEFAAFGIALFLSLGMGYFLARTFTESLHKITHGVEEIGKGNLKTQVHLETKDEFNDLAKAINAMAVGLEERERIKTGFSRYVSQHVLEKILDTDAQSKLQGERKKITVLFSDIRQFNVLIEQLKPERIVSLLNEYFERMMTVIFKYNGTLDKFISDGIMVEFGAPLEDDQQEKHAVLCAVEMQEELKKLCAKWEKEGHPKIDMGIGIHTGLAVVGNIGSERRLEYTAIGDTVNVASRLERATKMFKIPILVSETTFEPIKEWFEAENLGPVELPGRQEKISVYAVYAVRKTLPIDKP